MGRKGAEFYLLKIWVENLSAHLHLQAFHPSPPSHTHTHIYAHQAQAQTHTHTLTDTRHSHTHTYTAYTQKYICTHSEECMASRRAWAWNWGGFTCAWHQRGMEVAGWARNQKRRDNEKRQILRSVLIPLAWWERCGAWCGHWCLSTVSWAGWDHHPEGVEHWAEVIRHEGGVSEVLHSRSGYFEIKMKNMAACERTWKNLKFHDRTRKSPLDNKDRKNEDIFKYCSAHGKTLGFETNKLVSNYKIWLLHRHCFLCLEWTIEAIADKSIFLSRKKWWQISL